MIQETSPLVLLGVGTAGAAIARGIKRAFGGNIRYLLADTDASTGVGDDPFILLGGARLSGRGAGGDAVAARLAAEESVRLLDPYFESARLAIVVTSLGGGTGNGVTLEAVRHLSQLGIPSIVFATLPFAFEGQERQLNAHRFKSMIEEVASASFFLPLDWLVHDVENMGEAMRLAIDSTATGVTLFWRLLEKPGYIRLDTERIRHIIARAGHGRFAAVSRQGPDRAAEVVRWITSCQLLAETGLPVRSILCGILAGDDLRLSEVGQIADGIRSVFGENIAFDLGTVNDEIAFSGRLSVVVMLFSSDDVGDESVSPSDGRGRSHKPRGVLCVGPAGRGRFNNAEPTIWRDEDLDVPTYVRRNISLEF